MNDFKAKYMKKIIYKLKPVNEINKDPTGLDRAKRNKVESILGKKLSDTEWFDYKLMLQGLKRR